MKGKKVLLTLSVLVCVLAAGAFAQVPVPDPIPVVEPSCDLFKTPRGLESGYNLASCEIPGFLFEGGDPPLTGCESIGVPTNSEGGTIGIPKKIVNLHGEPLNEYMEFNVGTVDTIVCRQDPIDFNTSTPQPTTAPSTLGEENPSATTDIELVALHMLSNEPIKIKCDQGMTDWDVDIKIDDQIEPSLGSMRFTLDEYPNGTAISDLNVCPRVTFTRVGSGGRQSFDLYPCDIDCGPSLIGETTWSFEAPEGVAVLRIEGLTSDNLFFTEQLTPEERVLVQLENQTLNNHCNCDCELKYPHLSEDHLHQSCLPCPCDTDCDPPDIEVPAPAFVECTFRQDDGTWGAHRDDEETCLTPSPEDDPNPYRCDPDSETHDFVCINEWLDELRCDGESKTDRECSDKPGELKYCGHDAPPEFTIPDKDACEGDFTVTFKAEDCCENESTKTSTLTVVDTLPPIITPGDDEICIWPPNHRYVCFDKEDFNPEIAEICHEYDWEFVDCASDQPDNSTGDGDTTNDCHVCKGDGDTVGECEDYEEGEAFCVRAERQSPDPDGKNGRRYAVEIQAKDDCGNLGCPEIIAHVWVPHDGPLEDEDCVAPPPPVCIWPPSPAHYLCLTHDDFLSLPEECSDVDEDWVFSDCTPTDGGDGCVNEGCCGEICLQAKKGKEYPIKIEDSKGNECIATTITVIDNNSEHPECECPDTHKNDLPSCDPDTEECTPSEPGNGPSCSSAGNSSAGKKVGLQAVSLP